MNLHRPGRRAVLTLALATATAGLAAGPADAAAPTRIDAEYWGVDCVYGLAGGDTLFVVASGSTDGADGGVGAFIEDSTGSLVAEGQTDRFTFGDTFSTSMALGAGTLTIDASLTRGATTTTPVRERSGTSWTRGTTSTSPLDVAVRSVGYAGRAVDLAGGSCTGEITGFDVVTTNPSAAVYRDHDLDSDICAVAGLPDGLVRVTGSLPGTFVEVVADHGTAGVEKLAGDLPTKGGRGSMTADVVDLLTGEVTTTGSVTLALTRTGQRERQVEASDGIVERRTYTTYREDLTVRLADGRRGTATCAGVATTSHVWVGPHAGAAAGRS